MALVALALRGATFPAHAQWVWLRVYGVGTRHTKSSDQGSEYCVGKTPLPPTAFDMIPPFSVQQLGSLLVCVELWTTASADAAFMQFCGSCRIDTSSWTSDQATERWYRLREPHTENQTVSYSTYDDIAPVNRGNGAHVCVQATFGSQDTLPPLAPTHPHPIPDHEGGFRFMIPRRTVRQRASLRRLNVREVVEQSQVGVLEELLSTTLYGQVLPDDDNDSKPGFELRQALTVLQLACQYALHSTSELERCRSELQMKVNEKHRRIAGIRRSQAKRVVRRCNLARERDVLDCAVDGMKVLLREFDPEKLQGFASHQEDEL